MAKLVVRRRGVIKEDWPILSYSTQSEEEYEEDRLHTLCVIADVWVKESGQFVAFWAADHEDDCHVEFTFAMISMKLKN